MKYFFCVFLSLMTFCNVFSQNENEKIREFHLGFTFAPQAVTTFDKNPPFTLGAPLYLGPTIVLDDFGISPFYSFGSNSAGVFLTYQMHPHLGSYLVLDQSVNSRNGVYGFGLTTPLYKTYIQGFVEIGSSYGDVRQPALLTGMYMTFGKRLKSW